MLKNPFIKDSAANTYQVLINQINALENNLKTLTDTELRNKTFQLKKANLYNSLLSIKAKRGKTTGATKNLTEKGLLDVITKIHKFKSVRS